MNSAQTNGAKSDQKPDLSELTLGDRLLLGLKEIYKLQQRQNYLLEQLVEAQQAQNPIQSVTRPMQEYESFDWTTFGAEVMQTDRFGVARISYRGQIYTRRTNDSFGSEIWFSKAIGDGKYQTLICFKEFQPTEPLGRKAEAALQSYPRSTEEA